MKKTHIYLKMVKKLNKCVFLDRDGVIRYLIFIQDNAIKVFDLDLLRGIRRVEPILNKSLFR